MGFWGAGLGPACCCLCRMPPHPPLTTRTHTHAPPHQNITTQQAVPATLLPPALALAVEETFLAMGATAPPTDTDHFDKEALNSEQLQMMEEERLARKL